MRGRNSEEEIQALNSRILSLENEKQKLVDKEAELVDEEAVLKGMLSKSELHTSHPVYNAFNRGQLVEILMSLEAKLRNVAAELLNVNTERVALESRLSMLLRAYPQDQMWMPQHDGEQLHLYVYFYSVYIHKPA